MRHPPLVAVLLLAFAPVPALAGDLPPQAAAEVVDQLIAGLDSYMDPQVGRKVQARLRAQRSAYMRLDDRAAFAAAVSKDMLEASRDKHLKVSVETLDAGRQARLSDEQQALVDQRRAYGLTAIRRLPANIGYLNLSYFEQGEAGAELAQTALRLLQHTDALIIDLRGNRGGGGATDETLLGHLSRTPIPMVEIHWRTENGVEVMRRAPRPPAGEPLYTDKPVFVLTSNRTFSAAEGFAYDLKAAGRALLVGETTGGGANPANRPVRLGYGFRVFVPNGRVVHPTTGTNWEGVGVTPHISVPEGEALTEAFARALAVAKPTVTTARSEAERAQAIADPKAALLADQAL
jgi:C-terminal processing protease CtpA/Prc